VHFAVATHSNSKTLTFWKYCDSAGFVMAFMDVLFRSAATSEPVTGKHPQARVYRNILPVLQVASIGTNAKPQPAFFPVDHLLARRFFSRGRLNSQILAARPFYLRRDRFLRLSLNSCSNRIMSDKTFPAFFKKYGLGPTSSRPCCAGFAGRHNHRLTEFHVAGILAATSYCDAATSKEIQTIQTSHILQTLVLQLVASNGQGFERRMSQWQPLRTPNGKQADSLRILALYGQADRAGLAHWLSARFLRAFSP